MPTLMRCIGLAMLLHAAASPAQPAPERFDIDRYVIEGNTLLAPAAITTLLEPYTGKQREFADVKHAIAALRQHYAAAGFSIVGVSAAAQNLDGGSVTLHVVEARIGKINVAGNRHFDDANIRASLPLLSEKSAPKAAEISANVQLANESPSKQVDIVLHPGAQAGVVDVTIDVIDVPPLKTFLTFDNTGSAQTGEYRLGIGVQDANLLGRDDVATFNYVTSPGKENQVSLYTGSYRLPLYARGDSIDFIAAYSDVAAGTTQTVAGPLAFSGKGTVYGLRYNRLLVRHGEYSHRLVYGLDYRAYKNDCTLGSFGAAGCGPVAVDVTVRPVSLAYSGNWAKPGRISDVSISLSHNLPGAAHGQEGDFNAARPSPNGGAGASSRYTILRLGASMVNSFDSNWQVRAALSAQYARDALVAGEQFGIAGATTVRGFLEREIARDSGHVANFEIYSPNLMGQLVPGEGNLRGLLFYDLARAANNPLAGEERQVAPISSVGVGFRWNIQRNFNLRFDLARVIDAGGSRKAGDLRGHISVYFGL